MCFDFDHGLKPVATQMEPRCGSNAQKLMQLLHGLLNPLPQKATNKSQPTTDNRQPTKTPIASIYKQKPHFHFLQSRHFYHHYIILLLQKQSWQELENQEIT